MIDAKAYLQQVKVYDTHIDNKLEELARLKTLATQITSTIKPVVAFGGGNQDKLGTIVAKIVDLENEIDEAVDAYVDKRREASRLLEKLEDADQVAVLHKLYFEFKTWPEIALEMHMTKRNAQYIHGRALQHVRKELEHDSL